MNNTTSGSYMVQLDDTANETVESYLLRTRGPKHLSLNIVLPITVIYVFIFVTGVIGNIAVCVVIVRNNFMHTATNYYLFSLAVSDLTLLLLGLPNDLSVYWQQYPWPLGEVLCKFRALVSEMTSYTSVLTIVAFSMERYLAICHPLHSYAMSGLKRAVRIIAVVWVISFFAALPFAMFTTVDYVDYPPGSGDPLYESAFCAMLDKNVPTGVPVYELSSLLFFLVPMMIIIVLYVLIGLQIRQSSRHSLGKQMQGNVHGETKQIQSKKSIVRMLAAVVIAFFLCWAPFHAQRLLYLYAKDSPYYTQVNELLYTIAGCFYYFSSTVNPILYNLMSMKYRRAFRETLCGYSGDRRNRMSRELQSSFRDTTVPLNTTISTAECSRKSVVHRSTRNLQQTEPPYNHHHQQHHHHYAAAPSSDDCSVGRPPATASDVLVMISPVNGNAQCYKTLLRVTVQGSDNKPAATSAAQHGNCNSKLQLQGGSETQTENQHCAEVETCI